MIDKNVFFRQNRADNGKSARIGFLIALAAVVFTILVAVCGVLFEYIEIKEIGEAYTSIFFKQLYAKTIVQGISFLSIYLLLFINIIFLRRSLSVIGVQRALFDKLSTSFWVCLLISFIASFVLASNLSEKWLIFSQAQMFGTADPIFGKDIGYFIFQRPFLKAVVDSLFGLWMFLTIFIAVIYWFLGTAFGGYTAREFFGMKRIVVHNLVNVAALLIVCAAKYIYLAEDILYGSFGELQGAGFTAKTIWLNYYKFAPVLLIGLAITALCFLKANKNRAAVKTVLVFPAVAVLAGVLAFIVQSLVVSPNEVIKESENISANIKYTQMAYGLDDITEVVFDVKNDLTVSDLHNSKEITDNIRILDLSANLTVLNQIQGIRNYYKFNETDIVPYEINGEKTAVAITPREITKENLSDTADTYINRTLRYTHGFGVAMNSISSVTAQGQPEFLIKDIPPRSKEGIQEIKQPRIYYGELTNDYVVVGNEKYKELDYSEDQEDLEFSYDGSGGLKLTPFNRFLFAAKYGDIRLLISDLVSSNSRILTNRNIIDRLHTVAPFFSYDTDPYIIIDDNGRLKWIVDAYTTTNNFPYSQSFDGFNYIRNSVKAVIDAYDGDVTFYITDEADPIAKCYSNVYPNLFSKNELPKGIKEHIKYPEFMFDIQAKVYGKYHTQNPTTFYNKNDIWTVAKERYGTAKEEKEIEPYYNMMRLDGSDENELLMSIPYTLANKENMVAWLAVRNELENYGKLQVYKFPKDINIYGPMQVENRINSDMNISKELNLWSQGGSMVIRGNMIVVPIDNSILYVEPIYIASNNKTTLPELKQVIVSYDDKIVMKSSLGDALYALFGESAPQDTSSVVADSEQPEETNNEYETAAQKVIDEFRRVKEASAESKWNSFGQAMEALEKSVIELEKSIKKQ